MAISEGQRKILNIIVELSGRTTTTVIRDSVVVEYSDDLPAKEVYNYLNQLHGLAISQLILDQRWCRL
jgi:hypothetical protein